MQYKLTVVNTTYNTGSVTDELTFDNFYDMHDYILDNSEGWDSYHIGVEG